MLQTLLATTLIGTVKRRCQDHLALSYMNVLSHMNISKLGSRVLHHESLGLNELKVVRKFYGVRNMIDGKKLHPIIGK